MFIMGSSDIGSMNTNIFYYMDGGLPMVLKLRTLVLSATFFSLALTVSCSKPNPDEAVGVDAGSIDAGSIDAVGDMTGSDGSGDAGSLSSGSGDSSFSPETIYFGYDQAGLSGASQGQASVLAEYLRSNTSAAVEVIGHCDERGSEEYNIALGSRRANAVKSFLVNSGVDSSRISTASYGEEQPAVAGHDESAYSRNRRAEFVLTVK